jgi:hypothetical protein
MNSPAMTVLELRAACREWLDDPAHKARFDHPSIGQDQYDLQNMRVRVAEVMFGCNALLRNRSVMQVLREAKAVKELLG